MKAYIVDLFFAVILGLLVVYGPTLLVLITAYFEGPQINPWLSQ